MAKNDFAKTTKGGAYPLGHAKENKDASAYTGFKYPSGGSDKDIGTYKQPMANSTSASKSVIAKSGNCLSELNISVGGVSKGNYAPEKTYGFKVRGTGAATKGLKARGPMA